MSWAQTKTCCKAAGMKLSPTTEPWFSLTASVTLSQSHLPPTDMLGAGG